MKTLIIAVLILITINAFAQKQEAFFSSDSAGIKSIVNLVMENTKNKYHLDRVINQTWNVEFWYRYDPHTLVRIHFQIFPDKSALLKGLTGNYVDIFPFWKRYFQENADTAVIEKTGGVKSAAVSFLKGKIVYGFRRVAKPLWQISPLSLVAPTKK
jgi:hypothetical protein